MAAFLASTAAEAQMLVFTGRVLANTDEMFFSPLSVGAIPGVAGSRIHVLELGIGGDADAESGPALFSALGGGLDFSWSAGKGPVGASYTLSPTTGTLSARGFSYLPVSLWAEPDAPLKIQWQGTRDNDLLYTYGNDSQGTFFDDSLFPGSMRVWLRYEIVAVPEPSAVCLVMGLLPFMLTRSRKASLPSFS